MGIVRGRDGKATFLAIDSGRTPTEVLTVETNATRRCDVSAWLLGENGKDG